MRKHVKIVLFDKLLRLSVCLQSYLNILKVLYIDKKLQKSLLLAEILQKCFLMSLCRISYIFGELLQIKLIEKRFILIILKSVNFHDEKVDTK